MSRLAPNSPGDVSREAAPEVAVAVVGNARVGKTELITCCTGDTPRRVDGADVSTRRFTIDGRVVPPPPLRRRGPRGEGAGRPVAPGRPGRPPPLRRRRRRVLRRRRGVARLLASRLTRGPPTSSSGPAATTRSSEPLQRPRGRPSPPSSASPSTRRAPASGGRSAPSSRTSCGSPSSGPPRGRPPAGAGGVTNGGARGVGVSNSGARSSPSRLAARLRRPRPGPLLARSRPRPSGDTPPRRLPRDPLVAVRLLVVWVEHRPKSGQRTKPGAPVCRVSGTCDSRVGTRV